MKVRFVLASLLMFFLLFGTPLLVFASGGLL